MRKLFAAVAVVLAAFAVVVHLQPEEMNVTRSALLAAKPAQVFPHVNELKAWDAWSPWAKLDPQMKVAYEGPAAGAGAVMRWSGNKEVGEGSLTVTESKPAELIRYRLDFTKPMASTADGEFAFAPEGAGTRVTWSMSGRKNFLMKAMGLFMDCEKLAGEQFAQGLEQLGAAAARNPAKGVGR